MSNDPWHDNNSRYLATSLQWLRGRLQRLTAGTEAPAPVRAPAQRGWFGMGATATVAAPVSESSNPGAERDAAARVDPPPALLLLAERLSLSPFERDILLLCAAADLDPSMTALFASAQGSPTRNYPSFALALQLFDDPSWDALSPHRPLRYARLIDINQPGATPLTAAALRADERIVNYLKGLNALDDRLSPLVSPVGDAAPALLSASQQEVADDVLQQLRIAANDARLPPVRLVGADAGSKLALARLLCATLNRRLYSLALDALPTQKAEVENLARLWQRESMLLPLALYIDAENVDAASPDQAGALQWLLSRDIGLVFVGQREAPPRGSGSTCIVDIAKPTPREQHDAWLQTLPVVEAEEVREHVARQLSGQFNLNLQDIRQAAGMASQGDSERPLLNRCWSVCRRLTLPKLDALAQRLEPKATWDDLVLSDEATHLLRQIVGQVRERYHVYEDWGYARKMTRGLGINALFAGESGTGKTMAAEVLATELQLALYRIDLSAVVSKYIGETEKNLRRLFDAAEQGGAILFFDEADALFGKRSEVKDSHDRYANIEINYLLQRMESFSGLAILATNMKSALDTAFMRRLRFIVNFQFPGPAERRQIWQKALPAGVPCEAIDYDRLARFNVSGGNIHSIVLNAAFAAAQRGTAVTLPLLLSATRGELRKLEKPVNESEFR